MQVTIRDNIVLIGTAHISQESVDEVQEVIKKYKPDIVAVELCPRRYESLTQKANWENTPITSLLKSNKAYLMLAQTFLSSIQRRLGKEYGVEPGSEMVAALDIAKKKKIDIALVDRDISITLKRAWRKMGVREKWRLSWEFLKALVGYSDEELEELDLQELMKQDVISTMMEEFGQIAPSVSNVLIHERDQYIAKKILEESHKGKIVAVVGAGHLKGIEKHLKDDSLAEVDVKHLEEVPKKRFSVMKTIAYAIPIFVIALFAYLMLTGSWELATEAILAWIIINGSLSALGALIARGHPFSIIAAFAAAPITSLNPALAAGWFAGFVEAKMRTPMVKDFQGLSKIDSTKDFLNNRVIRLLMVVALANVGSILGTFVSLYYIIPKIF
ncbi:MAG: TraB/GumN family protein [Candidatus Thermoplasmatota archaeon]|nr:TraB/GumN family protein [Candidatus Thermoplasmatota archaeon]